MAKTTNTSSELKQTLIAVVLTFLLSLVGLILLLNTAPPETEPIQQETLQSPTLP
jgi:hypothetical protein